MKRPIIACVIIIIVVATLSHASDFNPALVSEDNATALSNAFSLDGVAGYVEGRAREAISRALSEQGSDWICDALADAINAQRKKDNGTKPAALWYQNPELKERVKDEIKKRIKEWLPKQAHDIIVNDILGNAVGEEAAKEAAEIAERVAKELDTTLNDQIDNIAGGLYDSLVSKMKDQLGAAGVPPWIDPTDLRKTIKKAFDGGVIANIAANQLARVMGDGTVAAIRGRIEDALAGNLPPEAISALKKGPEEFDKYVARAEKFFPGNAFEKIKSSVLNRPLFKLPTPAYAAILAGSAAGHFARAFKGVFVDAYELKRGVEVTRVMVWQLKNKEWLNMSIMQFGSLARGLAAQIGMGAAFDAAIAKMTAPLDKLQSKLKEIDALLKKPIEEVQAELQKITAEVEKTLKEIQDVVVGPLREAGSQIQAGLDQASSTIINSLPEDFNGIPADWDELKKKAGIDEGLLGKEGDITPADLLKISEAKKKAKEILDAASEKLAGKAADVLAALHLLGPAAKILGVEKAPAKNPSQKSPLDPVLLHNGEYTQSVTDIVIPGRGIDFRFTRTYRGRSLYLGELGWRWTHNFAERLRPWNDGNSDGLTYINEEGLKYFFRKSDNGFISPHGIYLKLLQREGKGYELIARDGFTTIFDAEGRPTEKRDRHGNCIVYEYDQTGLLASVSDVFGRKIKFERRKDGLISSVKDFAGRKITFEYNEKDELSGVRSPAVPNFPKGKLTAYRYEHAEENLSLAHALIMIMDPRGNVFLRNHYDSEGRIAAQRYGEGPLMTVQYAEGSLDVALRTWVTDQLGVVRLYEHDAEGHLLRSWRWNKNEYSLLDVYQYNEDGEKILECTPSGRCIKYIFGKDSERGLLLGVEECPSDGTTPRVTRIAHEPNFGQISEITYADGHSFKMEFADNEAKYPIMLKYKKMPNAEWETKARYSYDKFGAILSETDAMGVVTNYGYYPACDPDGDAIALTKSGCKMEDSGGYLKHIVRDSTGISATKTFTYDPIGNITSITLPENIVTRFTVNALNQIVREEKTGVFPVRYGFDANDNLIKVEIERRPLPIVHKFEYDSLDRPILESRQISENQRADIHYEYNAAGDLLQVASPEGNTTRYEYNEEAQLMCIVRGASSPVPVRECVERDVDGNILAHIDGSGVKIAYELNGFGEIARETNGQGGRREYDYDAGGRVIAASAKDASNNILAEERLEYEGELPLRYLRRLWRDNQKDSRWIENRFEYDASGNLKFLIDPLGNRTSIERDGLGREIAVTSPSGVRRITMRNAQGYALESYIADGDKKRELIEYSYDNASHLISINAGWNKPKQFSYDGLGRLISIEDPDNVKTTFELDDIGRRMAARRTNGNSESAIRYVWNKNNRLIRLVDPNGNATEFGYDELDRQNLARFAGGSEQRTIYDGAGRVKMSIDRNGARLNLTYDKAGQLILRTSISGKKSGLNLSQSFEYDGLGRLVSALDKNDLDDAADDVISRFVYDSLSRPIAESSSGQWILRGFDDAGRLATLQIAKGDPIYFAYDTDGHTSSVLGSKKRIASIEEDAFGKAHRVSLGNDLLLEIMRDAWGRQTGRKYIGADEKLIASWQWALDGAGRVVKELDSFKNSSVDYLRDELGRLIAVSESPFDSTKGMSWRYSYDPSGNILEAKDNNSLTNMQYNELNEISSITSNKPRLDGTTPNFTYDKNGNLTLDGRFGYEYDALGRLTGILDRGGHSTFFKYDTFGRRVRETWADVERENIWDGWRLIADQEHGGNESGLNEYIYTDGQITPLASVNSGLVSYFITDRTDSVRAYLSQGKFDERCDYSPYGAEINCGFIQPFGFEGTLRSGNLWLLYARNRNYNTALMRFIEPDPLGHKEKTSIDDAEQFVLSFSFHRFQGEASKSTIPNRALNVSLDYNVFPFGRMTDSNRAFASFGEPNLYTYAHGDPSRFFDPFGLASLVFERARNEMILLSGAGYEITTYEAHNNVTNPKGDPLETGSHGPFPDGTFAVGVPEFYSQEYRENFAERFGFGDTISGETMVTGADWAGKKEPGYNVSQGLIRFRIGLPSSGVDRVAWDRELFIHAGRKNRSASKTYGCIRLRDDEMETLAANFIELRREGDPVTSLTVR